MMDDDIIRSVSRKRSTLEEMLIEGRVQVHIDSATESVVLPEYLMDQPQVILNLSYAFRPEVFVIDDEGVQITLSFRGQKFLCGLPWSCIYVMQSLNSDGTTMGESAIFVESFPSVLMEQVSEELSEHLSEDFAEEIDEDTQEAEHTPELGIISLQRHQREREED